jgi:hypothetical protein
MNFDVFESLLGSGSVAVLAAVVVGVFLATVLFRVGSSINNQFKLVQEDLITKEHFVRSFLAMFVFIIFSIAFVQLIS